MRALPTPLQRVALWCLLALPGVMMILGWFRQELLTMDILEPSGDMAVRLMVLALLPGPLTEIIRPTPLLRGWLAIRRNLGVAAFGYAALHLAAYLIDMAVLDAILEELPLPGIWTGWLAMLLLVPVAITSNNAAMRWLRQRWKAVQRLVYPVIILSFVHWLLLEWSWIKAAIYALPLIIVWALRYRKRHTSSQRRAT